jgi:6-pyruvoyltetrahydropterin/6-carboxytetrahydropterin synthase
MVLDYADISAAMAPMLAEQLDHHHLNDSTGLDSPTSEALAAWLYGQLKPRLPGLAAVEIDETSSTICRYEP